mgnify:CR=1 FL=1|jgi:hypothetical protein|tara:strand:- start:524 stop:787 length:264 start_codon:yes stop_codon:yes gene_type:complete
MINFADRKNLLVQLFEHHGCLFEQVDLRQIKEGGEFKRKHDAKHFFYRNHYNHKDFFGPANFSCSHWHTGAEIFLKPSTQVYREVFP